MHAGAQPPMTGHVPIPAGRIIELADAAIDAAEGGDLDLCERLASQALDLAEALPGGAERDRAMAQALRPRGTAARARGRYAEAEATFERARAFALRGFGEESLEVAELLNDLGMTFKYAGRFADAERAYRRPARSSRRSTPTPRTSRRCTTTSAGWPTFDATSRRPRSFPAGRSRSARVPSVRGIPRRSSTGAPTRRSSTAWVGMTRRRPRSATSSETSKRLSEATTRRWQSR